MCNAAVSGHANVWNSLKDPADTRMDTVCVSTSLGTDASPPNFPPQSLVSDVASAGNEKLVEAEEEFCSLLNAFELKHTFQVNVPMLQMARRTHTCKLSPAEAVGKQQSLQKVHISSQRLHRGLCNTVTDSREVVNVCCVSCGSL